MARLFTARTVATVAVLVVSLSATAALAQNPINLPMAPDPSIIYFHNERYVAQPPSMPAVIRTMEKPKCSAANDEPCEDDGEYNATISAYIQHLLRQDRKISNFLSDPNLRNILSDSSLERPSTRFGERPSESPVCDAQETLIYPRRAKAPSGEWLFVVNQDDVQQAIKVEKCITDGGSCLSSDVLPDGTVTTCRQKYVYRRMLTLSTNQLQPEEVLMPSCCVCYSRSQSFDITSRAGNSTGRGGQAPPLPKPSEGHGAPLPPPAEGHGASPLDFPDYSLNSRRTYSSQPLPLIFNERQNG